MTLRLDNTIIDHQSILALTPQAEAGLSTPVLLDEGSSLDGDDFRLYTDPEQVQTDLLAAYLSEFAAEALTKAFNLSPRPAELLVASVGGSTGADYLEALDGLRDKRTVVAFTIDSRDPAVVSAVGVGAAGRNIIFISQSNDKDGFAGGEIPGNLSDLEGLEFNAAALHPENSEPFDFVWMVRNVKVNPDTNSRNWNGQVSGILAYDDDYIDQTELAGLLDVPINVIGEFGGEQGWVHPGQALNGRPISELGTAIWFDVRWKEGVSRLFKEYDNADLKFPIDLSGQLALQGVAEGVIGAGIEAGHFFSADQVIIELPAITEADRDNQRIPINISIMTLTGAIKITSSVTYSRQPIVED